MIIDALCAKLTATGGNLIKMAQLPAQHSRTHTHTHTHTHKHIPTNDAAGEMSPQAGGNVAGIVLA